jgi:hypothetical protein
MASDGFPHPSFTLIGGKWYMTLNGEVITVRPIELAQARGTAECVHCALSCDHYCRSCRRAVCETDFEVHRDDHTDQNATWTRS